MRRKLRWNELDFRECRIILNEVGLDPELSRLEWGELAVWQQNKIARCPEEVIDAIYLAHQRIWDDEDYTY